ncbi:MAG: dATP/dGTP diphosphohydrolase domain-containing protein [Gammaproteobacteria bacterium]
MADFTLPPIKGSDFVVKDSGYRELMDTGSVRDSREGKGRFDLIPAKPLKRIALVFEKGAAKYGERNWEKGQKISRALDSAIRHLNDYKDGEATEDHLAHAAVNLMFIMHFEDVMPEMQDIPTRPDHGKR